MEEIGGIKIWLSLFNPHCSSSPYHLFIPISPVLTPVLTLIEILSRCHCEAFDKRLWQSFFNIATETQRAQRINILSSLCPLCLRGRSFSHDYTIISVK